MWFSMVELVYSPKIDWVDGKFCKINVFDIR